MIPIHTRRPFYSLFLKIRAAIRVPPGTPALQPPAPKIQGVHAPSSPPRSTRCEHRTQSLLKAQDVASLGWGSCVLSCPYKTNSAGGTKLTHNTGFTGLLVPPHATTRTCGAVYHHPLTPPLGSRRGGCVICAAAAAAAWSWGRVGRVTATARLGLGGGIGGNLIARPPSPPSATVVRVDGLERRTLSVRPSA